MTFGQHDIWSTRHLVNMTFGQHNIWSTQHLVNTTFGQTSPDLKEQVYSILYQNSLEFDHLIDLDNSWTVRQLASLDDKIVKRLDI